MLVRRRLLLAGTTATAAGLAMPYIARAAEATRTLRIGYLFSRESQLGVGASVMADAIAKATSGAIRIDQFPDSALGGEVEVLKAVRLGSVDMAFITGAALPSVVPESDVFHIPFLF